jgi:hypothetical protein
MGGMNLYFFFAFYSFSFRLSKGVKFEWKAMNEEFA